MYHGALCVVIVLDAMKVFNLLATCMLQASVSVSAAPKKLVVPSFIPPSTHAHNIIKQAADETPLFLRGGQQITSTSRRALLDPSVLSASPFIQYNAILATVNLLGMGISLTFPRMQYHLDLLGTGAFALASILTVSNGFLELPLRVQISSVAVIIWSVKLASFLFFRACKVKTDGRLEGLLSTTSGTIAFWIMSFLWGLVSSLPHSLGLASTNIGNKSALIIGTVIYAIGLITETVADYQKWMSKQHYPGKFCNVGLWSVSQHPNFFGNFLIWSGITLMNISAMFELTAGDESAITHAATVILSSYKAVFALLSPAFLWLFFVGQAKGEIGSGVEESMKRYGSDEEFRKYIDTVPLFAPDLRRIFR